MATFYDEFRPPRLADLSATVNQNEQTSVKSRAGRITQSEIQAFSIQKRRNIDMTFENDPAWREQIRREIEMEIERQVREALDTPPLERMRRNKDKSSEKTGLKETRHVRFDHNLVSDQRNEFEEFESSRSHRSTSTVDKLIGKIKTARQAGDNAAYKEFHHELYKILFGRGENDTTNSRPIIQLAPSNLPSDRRQRNAAYNGRSREDDGDQPSARNVAAQQHRKTVTFAESSTVFDANNFDKAESRIRRGREALQSFGDLSPVEKELFFSNFTKEGFVLAKQRMTTSRKMQLPDGSTMQCLPNGQFKDQYGLTRDEHGPFWPKDFGPVCSSPSLKRIASPKIEPLLSTDANKDKPHERVSTLWRAGIVVYDSVRSNPDQAPMSPSPNITPSLAFESRFECGNLRQARRIADLTYELVLSTDLYTKRHTQWYYFRVRNALPHVTYTFIIVNLLKKSSLYSDGMQPLFYSEKAEKQGIGWVRMGKNVRYVPNLAHLSCPLLDRNTEYYQLEWTAEFPHADDTCYFAHCYPYAFSDLKFDLDNILSDPKRKSYVHREVLCETLLGNSCFVLTVSNFAIARPSTEHANNASQSDSKRKKVVVVTARVHPGETNSSWVMKGLLEFLTSESAVARSLRDKFLFKLIPMLNPDGVIVGNYRCALIGKDLNRNYRRPRKERIPTIWHTKEMIRSIAEKQEIFLYCDLHGHSRKSQSFVYGCDVSNTRPEDAFYERRKELVASADSFFSDRMFSWLLHEQAGGKFDFGKCNFKIAKHKEATGRAVMWRQLGIDFSFTFEVTFSGSETKNTNADDEDVDAVPRHFNIRDLEDLGEAFGNAILKLDELQCDAAERREKFQAMLNFMMKRAQQQGKSNVVEESTASVNSTTKRTNEPNQKSNPASVNATAAVPVKHSLKVEDVLSNFVLLKPRLMALDAAVKGSSESSDSDSDDTEPDLPKYVLDKTTKKKRKVKRSKTMVNFDTKGAERDKESSTGLHREMTNVGVNLPQGARSHRPQLSDNDAECAYCKSKGAARAKERSSTHDFDSDSNDGDDWTANDGMCTCRAKRESSFAFASSKFVNRYENRTNCGIPCFSLERTLERAQRRLEEAESRFADDPEKKGAFKSECEKQIGDLKARLRILLVGRKSHEEDDENIDSDDDEAQNGAPAPPVPLKMTLGLNNATIGDGIFRAKMPVENLSKRAHVSVSKRKKAGGEEKHDDFSDQLIRQSLANGIVSRKNQPILDKIRRNCTIDPRHFLLERESQTVYPLLTLPSSGEHEHSGSVSSFTDADLPTARSLDSWPAPPTTSRSHTLLDAFPAVNNLTNLLHDRAELNVPSSLKVIIQKPRTLPRLKNRKTQMAITSVQSSTAMKH